MFIRDVLLTSSMQNILGQVNIGIFAYTLRILCCFSNIARSLISIIAFIYSNFHVYSDYFSLKLMEIFSLYFEYFRTCDSFIAFMFFLHIFFCIIYRDIFFYFEHF